MERLRVTYRLRGVDDPEARAEELALEQTVELPRAAIADAFVEREILPRIESIREEPPEGSDPGSQATTWCVTLGFPVATTACDPAQLLNVAFGNASLQPDVELLDVEPPPELRQVLGGPRFGVEGFRKAAGVLERPLTCTALKPMGLGAEAIGARCETFARAGIDVIKDDHGLADHAFCPFEARVTACRTAIERAADATGHRARYVPSLTGAPESVLRQLRFAERCGVRAVLVSPMLIGLPTLHALARYGPGLPILAHPALGGATRIAPEALLGRLFRLLGADAVIFPSYGGRFSYTRATCERIAGALRGDWAPLRPALPVPAGGMSVERVPELVDFYGADAMLLIGASLYEAGDALLERSREFVAAVHAASPRAVAGAGK